MNSVKVIVTSKTLASYKGYVIPYDHRVKPHLQHYVGSNGKALLNDFVTYEVPLYEIHVVGGSSYKAIRFGLRNRGDNKIPESRPCDTGLSMPRVCTPSFLPHYKPHSFLGEGPVGAWQLLPNAGLLIHEGGNSQRDVVGGSLGCIEIVDGGWRCFQRQIEDLAGAPCGAIGAAKMLTVALEYAAYPVAKLY
jgi:hypothetical protein